MTAPDPIPADELLAEADRLLGLPDHPRPPAGEGRTPALAFGAPVPDGSSAGGMQSPGAGASFLLGPMLGALHRIRASAPDLSTEGYPPTFPGSPPGPPPTPAPKR